MKVKSKSSPVTLPAVPEDKKLGHAVKLRIFATDQEVIKTVSAKTAMPEDLVKRVALHSGLRQWISELSAA